MRRVIAWVKDLGPKQRLAVLAVLLVTFVGAVLLAWAFTLYNRGHA